MAIHPSTFSASSNQMDFNASSTSGAGPSSCPGVFHPLNYPDITSLDDTSVYPICEDDDNSIFISGPTDSASTSTFDVSGMFDPDYFPDYHTNFLYPNTPSTASSNSELSTPLSPYGNIDFPGIDSGDKDDADMDIEQYLRGVFSDDATNAFPDYSDPLFTSSKPSSDEPSADWAQLLAALCDENPEAVQWFAEMGGFEGGSDQTDTSNPPDDNITLLQPPSSMMIPDQHSDALSPIFQASSSLPPLATLIKSSSAVPSIPVPLHQPQPVRPIPQIPLKDLAAAAAAMRLAKPRGPRNAHQTISSLSLLCQPVADAVRYQRKRSQQAM